MPALARAPHPFGGSAAPGAARRAKDSGDPVEITDTAAKLKAIEAKLSDVPDVDRSRVEAVRDSLEAERQALAARDGEALLRAVSGKAASIASADTVEDRRQALMDRLGIADRPGRGSRGFSADAGISQRWQQVLALTQQCRALNYANGQMIRGQKRRVDGALRILRGEPAAPSEYRPAGESRGRVAQRLLGPY